jgi:MFS family permease
LIVSLTVIQGDLGVSRADVSLAYTLTMVGFCIGGIAMGRVVDAHGIVVAMTAITVLLALGFAMAQLANGLLSFVAVRVELHGKQWRGGSSPLLTRFMRVTFRRTHRHGFS